MPAPEDFSQGGEKAARLAIVRFREGEDQSLVEYRCKIASKSEKGTPGPQIRLPALMRTRIIRRQWL
ncbi:MAG: hypothetical protein LBJ82_05975, partial [Deltaproteobacteria bacterium]|nr:hypothetical protein [Deltaproteobacteria bacterium]